VTQLRQQIRRIN